MRNVPDCFIELDYYAYSVSNWTKIVQLHVSTIQANGRDYPYDARLHNMQVRRLTEALGYLHEAKQELRKRARTLFAGVRIV